MISTHLQCDLFDITYSIIISLVKQNIYNPYTTSTISRILTLEFHDILRKYVGLMAT